MSKILITGSTGHLGKATIGYLLKQISPDRIVAFARDRAKAQELIEKDIEIRIGDFDHLELLEEAMQGIDQVLLVSGMDANRLQQHKNVIDAASRAGVRHIVYTGVALKSKEGTALKEFMGGHFQTEEYIQQSGMSYTFMRNSLYAEMVPNFTGADPVKNGIFLPTGDGKVPFVFREEIAEATANVLAGDGHTNKTYDITGSTLYSFEDLAIEIGKLTDEVVTYTNAEEAEYIQALNNAQVNEHFIEILAGFAADIRNHQYEIISPALAELLGRAPIALSSKLKEIYKL